MRSCDAPPAPYATLAEVEDLVQRFEAAALPRSPSVHPAYLTVAGWYLVHYPEHVAAERTIEGIRAHNRAHHIRQSSPGGYHETITLFWLAVTRRFLTRQARGAPPLDVVNALVAELGARPRLVFEHYSRARLMSWKARHMWVEPDLRPLDAI